MQVLLNDMASLDCADAAAFMRKAGLAQSAVPPELSSVKQGLWDALVYAAARSSQEAGVDAEPLLSMHFLRWAPKPSAQALATALGVAWDEASRGSRAERVDLWNAAGRRLSDATIPVRHLAGVAALLGWIQHYSPPMTWQTVAARMFGPLKSLVDAGKLLQAPTVGALAAAAAHADEHAVPARVAHTMQTLLLPVFKELQLAVDPLASGARRFPAWDRQGARSAVRAMANLVLHAFKDHGGLYAIPQVKTPEGLAAAEPAEFLSDGDGCAECISSFVDELCFIEHWEQAITAMFPSGGAAGEPRAPRVPHSSPYLSALHTRLTDVTYGVPQGAAGAEGARAGLKATRSRTLKAWGA